MSLQVAAGTCCAQRAPNWRTYKLADGLPESACISVTISSQGRILARHAGLPLVSELDGYTISTRPAPDIGRGRIYQSPGGQLWSVVPQGLKEFKGGEWVLHRVPEITAAFPGSTQAIDPIPLCPVRQGLLLALLPEGLLEINAEELAATRTRMLRKASQTHLGRFLGMGAASGGGLWISAEHGLARLPGPLRLLRPETDWSEFPVPESEPVHNVRSPHEYPPGMITALAESTTTNQSRIAGFDGDHWTINGPAAEKLRQAWAGPDLSHWALTTDSLLQQTRSGGEWRENEEISARQYFDVAVEPGGAFWLATSDGLFRCAPLIWQTPAALRGTVFSVSCVAGDQEGRVWFASGNRVQAIQNGLVRQFGVPGAASSRFQARAFYQLKSGALVLAAEATETGRGDQLFKLQVARALFGPLTPEPELRNLRALGMLKDGTLCLQDLDVSSTTSSCALEQYDGRKFEAFPDAPPASSLGTNLTTLFSSQNGDLWLSGELGTAWLHEKKWRAFSSRERVAPESVVAFIELPDGRLWAAAQDQLWEFDGHNWSVARRGFDRINDVTRTRDGSIWVASNNGLHRYFQGAWVENGPEEGLPASAVRKLFEDARGQLWAGTVRGLSLFHPEADADPPQTVITEISENEANIPAGSTVTFIFNGRDKWKYTPADRLLYSLRLDEQDWSAFQELNHISFTDLPAGKHVLQVRAMDRNCNMESRSVREFAFVLPWYKETRLVWISAAGAVVALFFAALAFNRHRRLLRSYSEIEQKVRERTHQLEMANRELLHSQKMNALGTLAAGIAHDFNNILSIIKGSAQIIEDNLDNPEKIRTRADRIRTVVEQGAGIVKAMLGFSRASDEAPRLCDVNAVVEETLKLLGDRFLREVQLSFHPAADLPPVVASKDFIQQIVLNFLFNAAESMLRNRRVVLSTKALDRLPAELVLAPANARQYVSVSVEDFGCGISAQTMPRIFEPFFTTKGLSARRGTGLGLSMVYELAKRLGAGLAVESVVDQGSLFTLILPVTGNSEIQKP